MYVKMVYKLVKIYCDNCPFNVTIIYTGKTEEECWQYYEKHLKGKECVKCWHYEVRQFVE